jgi:GNAT superfamily N-acetyltransferase
MAAKPKGALKIRPLTKAGWPQIAELFGEKGACGGCWCMYWRVERGGQSWDAMRGRRARRQFHDLVAAGKVKGLLAFSGDVPVGWACVGPYEDFPRLERVRAFARERPRGTWAVVCFYIPAKWRRSGIATRLLEAARDLALAHGASIVEGYPVTIKTKQGLPGAFAWTGVPSMYARAKFRRLGGAGLTRHVWMFERAPSSGRT